MTSKVCFKCKIEQPITSFHKHSQMKDGHLNKCSSCTVKDVAEWRLKNPGVRKAEYQKVAKRDGIRPREEWFRVLKENAIGRKVSATKYMHKRRINKERLCFTELDNFVVEEALALTKLREDATGFKWNLDHIVPIHHKNACGLHVAANIQVVPASWNFKKGNRNMDTFFEIAGY